MSRWTVSARRRRAVPPSALPAPARAPFAAAAIATAVAAVLGATALSGCTKSHPAAATESPASQLDRAAGVLDAAKTFRLTVDTRIPLTAASPGPSASAGASAKPRSGPSVQTPGETVKMSGVWDIGAGLARMDGTVNTVKTTILSAAGVEYVSLTPEVASASGRQWLKADNSDATFGDFCQPAIVAQLLRAYHEVHQVAAGHLAGIVETAEADQHIADPGVIASLASLPDELRFDVWTDGSGAPTAVGFTLAGAGAVTTGTARLDSFGTTAPQVSVPTINQVVQAPAG